MNIDMLTCDDWFVLMVNGEKVDEGHRMTGAQAFEVLEDVLNDKKKFPAGIGEFKFRELWIDDMDEDGSYQLALNAAEDQIESEYKVQKTLRTYPSEWRQALFNLAHGKDVEWNSYPYGVLEKTGVIQTVSYKRYAITDHGKDVVAYLDAEMEKKRAKL